MPRRGGIEADLAKAQRAKIDRLREALEIADSWLTRWAAHVGNCQGGSKCTCGLSRVRYDVAHALETESPDRER